MADDDRPRGTCVIDGCPRDPYPRDDGRVPLVCGPDVSRMRTWLREVPQLVDELAGGGFVMRDQVGERLEKLTEDGGRAPVARYGPPPARLAAKEPDHPLVLRAGQPVEHRDLVANLLPVGPIGGTARGGPVSGSPVRRLPIDVDAVDLLAPASRRMPAVAVLAELAYPEQDDDQIGFLPVAMMLDQWAEILREHRDRGEGMPTPSVTALCGWLAERIDEAADDWLPVDEFFEDLRRAHGALRGQLGLIEPPQYLRGVPCPKCQILSALVRLDTVPDDPDRISCSACGALLTIPEYEEYTTMLSATLTAEGREAVKRAAADRRAAVRLLREMHAVGWRHTVSTRHNRDYETGMDEPVVEHQWLRGAEVVLVPTLPADAMLAGAISFQPTVDADWPSTVMVGIDWVASNGVKRLHALAAAAGVLSVPRERAA